MKFTAVLSIVFLVISSRGAAAAGNIVEQISVPGDFDKISDAVKNGVPSQNKEWILIKVAPGVYEETVIIPPQKPYIVLEGSGRDNTIIAYASGQNLADGPLVVRANNFIARGITFKNTKDMSNGMSPAIAALVQGDQCSFYNCGFISLQDTLWDYKGTHFFSSCYIEGIVDFIFGDGTSIYQDCTINSTGSGYITAQGRESEEEPSGFVFKFASVTGSGPTILGRAWKPYARVLFYESTFADVIDPKGWDDWGKPVEQLSYSEVDCNGKGAEGGGRIPWMKSLSSSELNEMISVSFIDKDGWLQNQPSPHFPQVHLQLD